MAVQTIVVDKPDKKFPSSAAYTIRRQRGQEAKKSSYYDCAGYRDMDPDEVGVAQGQNGGG